jgi:hypothetical protein
VLRTKVLRRERKKAAAEPRRAAPVAAG